ncbi:MAG: peptide deformylase [Patescibacteria group bacterium]|jgi:peptide deformylase
MLKILTIPHPLLRKKALTIKNPLDKEIQKLIPQMVEIMLAKDGVGLAAPQIGQGIRLITVRHKDGNLVMLNPQIIKKSMIKEWDEEGCLSVPNIYGDVRRCKKITVKFVDSTGKSRKLTGEGLLARVVQHEVDHLDGVLFIDKAKNLRKLETV